MNIFIMMIDEYGEVIAYVLCQMFVMLTSIM